MLKPYSDDLQKAEKQRREDYLALFTSERGKRVLADMKMAHHFRATLEQPDRSDRQFFQCEGERNVILRILGIVDAGDPDLIEEAFYE